MKFLDHILINPCVTLIKGKKYPFIEMANVAVNNREPIKIDYKVFSSGVKFQNGDTVIARIEPCLQNGKKFFCHNIGEGFGSTEFLVFRPKDNFVENRFLYYYLQTESIQKSMIGSMTGATGRQRVNNDIFKTMDINIPCYKIQKKIADILSAYDDLIENNQKQIKLLEEAAQRLYKEWFVDLRFPGYETTPIIDDIPQVWKKELVGNIIDKSYRSKQVMACDYLKEGAIPIIDQSRDFIAGYTNDQETIVDLRCPVIVFGDHTRILKYIQFPFAKGADGTQLIVSISGNMPQSLLYFSLLNVDLSNYHYARHFKYLKAKEIIVPDIETATKFKDYVEPILQKVQILRTQIYKAQQARDRLLPKLMNGEIEV